MEKLKILDLLIKYETWVKKGEIKFLKNKPKAQKTILRLVNDLISDFREATGKEGGLSVNLDWHRTHMTGQALWENLASAAVNDIDSDSKGNSKLFDFITAATNFEDLLYGLDTYYRDHTLHSIWVYFVGEHILRDFLPDVHGNLNWYVYNDIERDKSDYSDRLLKDARQKEKELYKKVNEHRDAIWCLISLCHDLGYSVSKLDKLNEKVKDVLKFFDIPDFQHVGYSLDIEHQFLVSQFLELMAMEVRIVPSIDMKDIRIRCYRDDTIYWRLCRGFEKKQHGILSSYLIYKILGIFADASVRGVAEEWGFEDSEAIHNIILGDILFAIAQHEFDFAHLSQLSSLADILILADEIEEFSRYGRPLSSRAYYDTTAEVGINFKKAKQGRDIEIEIKYEVDDRHPLKVFFKNKTQSLCRMYSLRQQDTNVNNAISYTIQSIKMTAEQKDENLFLHLRKDAGNKGYLPGAEVDGVKYKKGEYSIEIYDDKLHVDTKDKMIPLNDWLKNGDK